MAITLTVKSTTGEKVEVEVESVDVKVSELKAALEQKTGIPASEQRLIFAGHVLKDDNALSAHNIKESGVTLNMVRSQPKKPEPAPESEPPRRASALSGPGMAEARALLSDPQAAQLFLQLLQNPELMQQAMQEMPELATPEFQQALHVLRTNPQALRQFVQAMQQGGPDLHEFTADELNNALRSVMSNLNISAGAPEKPVTAADWQSAFAAAVTSLRRGATGARVGARPAGARRTRPEHRFITKEFLQQCLNNVMRTL